MTKKILVICTGNRCRSQMAHGWLQKIGGPGFQVASAGTDPTDVHPLAIEVMQEVGVDISNHTSNHVDEYRNEDFDLVMTVCDSASEACPVFPGAKQVIHHSFADPDVPSASEESLKASFRRLRDQIGVHCRGLLHSSFDESPSQPTNQTSG